MSGSPRHRSRYPGMRELGQNRLTGRVGVRLDVVPHVRAGGIDDAVRATLDRITRLWLPPKQHVAGDGVEPGNVQEWRLALEGFGTQVDFADSSRILDDVTPLAERVPGARPG